MKRYIAYFIFIYININLIRDDISTSFCDIIFLLEHNSNIVLKRIIYDKTRLHSFHRKGNMISQCNKNTSIKIIKRITGLRNNFRCNLQINRIILDHLRCNIYTLFLNIAHITCFIYIHQHIYPASKANSGSDKNTLLFFILVDNQYRIITQNLPDSIHISPYYFNFNTNSSGLTSPSFTTSIVLSSPKLVNTITEAVDLASLATFSRSKSISSSPFLTL